ncbi:MAG: DUF5317 family protein [Acidimicrobiales bacterium]
MISALLAVVVGALIGLYRGGQLSNLGGLRIESWPLLGVGVAIPLLVSWTDPPLGGLFVFIALGCLIAFALMNFTLTGMGVVAFGLFLNLIPIMVNGSMPVSAEAMVRADMADSIAAATQLDLAAPRHVEQAGDHLVFLGDTIPIGLFDQVLSFGDMILLVGLATVVANSTRRRPRTEEGQRVLLPALGGIEPALTNRFQPNRAI